MTVTTGFDPRKYTDRDVRESQQLREFAFWYVQHYTGDYEYLVAFHRQITEGHRRGLTTAEARAILNCARHDPDYADQIPLRPSRRQFGRPGAGMPHRPAHPAQRSRPAWVKVAATFKGFYVRSTAKMASACHIIDHRRSELVYYPHVDEWRPRIYTYCCSTLAHHTLRLENTVAEGFHECRACRERYDEVSGE